MKTTNPKTPLSKSVASAQCERWTMKAIPDDVRNLMEKVISVHGRDKKYWMMLCLRAGLAKYADHRNKAHVANIQTAKAALQ